MRCQAQASLLGISCSEIQPTDMCAPNAVRHLRPNSRKRPGLAITAFDSIFNCAAVASAGLDLVETRRALAGELMKNPEVAYAYAGNDISRGLLRNNAIETMVSANHQPKRYGDVYVVFRSQSFINDFDGLVVAATHGSVWRYDRYVPVIFAGNRISAATVSRPITPYDIATTLSNRLKIKAPSGAIGEPLSEVTP